MYRCLGVATILFGAAACHSRAYESASGALADPSGEVVMRSATGEVLGTLRMEDANGTVRLVGMLSGVPEGGHDIHIHAAGRCDGPSFETAGAHLNPTNRQHGLQNPAGPHAGDAPSIQADAARHVNVDLAFPAVTLSSATGTGLWDANGSAVVIHADLDDQKTDPSGNSGPRIACGVVDRVP